MKAERGSCDGPISWTLRLDRPLSFAALRQVSLRKIFLPFSMFSREQCCYGGPARRLRLCFRAGDWRYWRPSDGEESERMCEANGRFSSWHRMNGWCSVLLIPSGVIPS